MVIGSPNLHVNDGSEQSCSQRDATLHDYHSNQAELCITKGHGPFKFSSKKF